MASPYKIHLDTYDGPLDLLLDLIKKQEIDIHNIPIAKITGQYLEYLHKLEQLDMDISADFIYMAATLIYIKSKMLLPPDPLAGPEGIGRPARRPGAPARRARKIQERRATAPPAPADRGARLVQARPFAVRRRRERKASWSSRWWTS